MIRYTLLSSLLLCLCHAALPGVAARGPAEPTPLPAPGPGADRIALLCDTQPAFGTMTREMQALLGAALSSAGLPEAGIRDRSVKRLGSGPVQPCR